MCIVNQHLIHLGLCPPPPPHHAIIRHFAPPLGKILKETLMCVFMCVCKYCIKYCTGMNIQYYRQFGSGRVKVGFGIHMNEKSTSR